MDVGGRVVWVRARGACAKGMRQGGYLMEESEYCG